MTKLEQYIKSYFGVVATNDLHTIVTLFTMKTIKKGDFLLEAGKRCVTLCFVESGLLRIFATTDDKEVTQWISQEG